MSWHSTYLGTFEPNHDLHALAGEYHARCEAYDRTVCTGPIVRGSILPVTPREMALIGRNAHRVARDVMEKADAKGIDRDELRRAIARWQP